MWKSEFISKLFPPNVNDMDMEEAERIKNAHIPSKLYKYRKCDSKQVKALKEETIHLTPAKDFKEDIMECTSALSYPKIAEHIHNALRSKSSLNISPTPQERELEKTFNEMRDNVIRDNVLEMVKHLGDKARNSTYISCFCESNGSPQMWGRYAGSHKGFCVEYDFKSENTDEMLRKVLVPVIYQENPPDITPYLLKKKDINNLIGFYVAMFKHVSWKEEQEWRLIFPMGTFKPFNMPGPAITAIYVGANITESNKKKLSKIASEKDINVYQMEIDGYDLNAKLIQTGTGLDR